MNGSEKQIKWAEQIVDRVLNGLYSGPVLLEKGLKERFACVKKPAVAESLKSAIEIIANVKNAGWVINNRNNLCVFCEDFINKNGGNK